MASKLLTNKTPGNESDYETSSSPCIRHLRQDYYVLTCNKDRAEVAR